MHLHLCCPPQNDLYQVLASAGTPPPRFDTAAQALENAPDGAGVLILADGYPGTPTAIDEAVWENAQAKHMRLYVEYPSWIPDLTIGPPRTTHWERAVVSSDIFGPTLRQLRILAIHGGHFMPMTATHPHLVFARVAGFDTAVYGLPEEVFPILFEHPCGHALIATTKLSQFVTGRYAPREAWQIIWRTILRWLCPGEEIPDLAWTPVVRPSYAPTETLPSDVEVHALRRGGGWFRQSGLLVHPSRETEIAERIEAGTEEHCAPSSDAPTGDGSHGILEGYSSRILHDGSQYQRLIQRSDCIAESAMGLAFGEDADGRKIAVNLLDFLYFTSIAQQGVRAAPDHPAFGLIAWGLSNWGWEKAFYGDDNARVLLSTCATAALLESDRWDEAILKCLLANLRTTGTYGFRPNRIDLPDLEANGWRSYFNGDTIYYAPHYQAYLWACHLWAYRHTGYDLFLQRAQTAIRMTMNAYPDQWRWTNGIAQERARMLLPLAWLVRVRNTPEHRRWLRRVAEDLLALQAPCGALREELGSADRGAYGPPKSNEEYGQHEATLMQANGDPLCDLLYTTNFAFLGLHEAAAATGDRLYADAEEKLAAFLCRMQVRSEVHPELDGAWFRAFDFERWEYWASNADAGWGAWSIETGWTQGWIVGVLGLRRMDTSLWDLTAGSRIQSHFARSYPLLFPNGDDVATERP